MINPNQSPHLQPKQYRVVLSLDQSENEEQFLSLDEFDISKVLSIFGWQLKSSSVSGIGGGGVSSSITITNNQQQIQQEEAQQVGQTQIETPQQQQQLLIEDSSTNNILFCLFCGRTILLSNYSQQVGSKQNVEDNRHANAEQGGQQVNKQQLNPLEEHRWFCKWGNLHPCQSKIYGWNICLNQLFDTYNSGKSSKIKTLQTVDDMYQIKCDMDNTKQVLLKTKEKFVSFFNQIEKSCKELYVSEAKERRQEVEDIIKDMEGEIEEFPIKKIKID